MNTTDICRVCEVENDWQYNIYEQENADLLIMLRLLTNVQFDKNDFLPKYLCVNCAGRLSHAYAFKIQVETTDRKLRELRLESEEIDIKLALDEDDEVKSGDSFDCEYQAEFLEEYDESHPASGELEEKQEESDEYEEKFEIEGSVCEIFIAPYVNPLNDQKLESDVASDPLEKVQSSVKSDEENIESNQNDSIKPNTKSKRIVGSKIRRKMEFKCDICSRCFFRKDSFVAHQFKHTADPKKYPCHLCDRKYVNSANLNRHIRVAHRKEKTHSCEICGKTFSQGNSLKFHQVVHITEKNFECDECGRKYKTHFQLDAHKKVHDPVLLEAIQSKRRMYNNRKKMFKKFFSCQFCDYRSPNSNSLKTHIRTHTGEKPYECTTCEKRFHSYISYKLHLMMHNDERPFHCDICGGTYRQWAHLKNHQRKHSDAADEKKPFLCDLCGKSFSQKPNLRIHRRIHTGERPFQCSVCGTGYSDKAALKKHLLKHGKVDSI